jgi:tungstate transport system substrate-binding protein
VRFLSRRKWLAGSLAIASARAAARIPVTEGALRLGADRALVDSGLARALVRGFGRDTGIAVEVVAQPVIPLLEALAAGEYDAGLANAPDAVQRLDAQGLVHDVHPIASGEFVLVGPSGTRERTRAAATHDMAAALASLHAMAEQEPAAFTFLTADDGSAEHFFEQAAWRAANVAPHAPWYQRADRTQPLALQARQRHAWAIVERGAWSAHGGAPLVLRVDGDPAFVEQVQAMRAFHSPHPAGKIFIAWIAGGRGRAVVASDHGYRVPR